MRPPTSAYPSTIVGASTSRSRQPERNPEQRSWWVVEPDRPAAMSAYQPGGAQLPRAAPRGLLAQVPLCGGRRVPFDGAILGGRRGQSSGAAQQGGSGPCVACQGEGRVRIGVGRRDAGKSWSWW